mmetsp:Transcript_69025/g.133207  ORF Transcript_69025/g.133207 Transcript_69025/m.133207 type:complete len:134 (+) Transcript_69025:331-732(+)
MEDLPAEVRESWEMPASSVLQPCRVVAGDNAALFANIGLFQHSLLRVAGLGLGDKDLACFPRGILDKTPSIQPASVGRVMPAGETFWPDGETTTVPGCSLFFDGSYGYANHRGFSCLDASGRVCESGVDGSIP